MIKQKLTVIITKMISITRITLVDSLPVGRHHHEASTSREKKSTAIQVSDAIEWTEVLRCEFSLRTNVGL